jgi:hypothetical protein
LHPLPQQASMVRTGTNIPIVAADVVQLFYKKVLFSEKHNYIDLVYWFSFNSTTCFGLLFRFRNNNNKFYNNRIIPVCMEKPLPLFYSPCEAVFRNANGWNRQPKHVVELNKTNIRNLCSCVARKVKPTTIRISYIIQQLYIYLYQVFQEH